MPGFGLAWMCLSSAWGLSMVQTGSSSTSMRCMAWVVLQRYSGSALPTATRLNSSIARGSSWVSITMSGMRERIRIWMSLVSNMRRVS